jgi:DNA-binding MarR family transcriptional regulator
MSVEFEHICQELENLLPLKNVTPFDILSFNDPLRMVLNHAFRTGQISLTELATRLGIEIAETEMVARLLVEKGLLKERTSVADNEKVFDARFSGRMRGVSDRLSAL